MDGAVCMGLRITSEIDKLQDSFSYLLEEYQKRLSAARDARFKGLNTIETATEWLIEAIKTAGF